MWQLVLRLAALIAIFFIAPNYSQNPTIIIIACILCALVFLSFGDDQICVYSDRITQTDSSLLRIIFKFKTTTYYIKDIQKAYLQERYSEVAEVGVAVLMKAVLPKRISNPITIPVLLDLKDGQTIQIRSVLENSKLKTIVDLVNSLIR